MSKLKKYKKILLATRNPGKIREVRALLVAVDIDLVGLAGRDDLPDCIEDGLTFTDNARKKARHFAELTGLPAIGEDSGLVVDALDGRPGVHSARYAGPDASDEGNVEKLLDALKGVPADQRTGRFVCHLVWVDAAGQILFETENALEGIIAAAPVGDGGFGYDPVFFLPEKGCTTAELSAEEKNAVSHRGQAFRRFARFLRE